MTLKKKIAVTTVAASLVFGSLSGIPLSGKGIVEKLGLNSVAYATTTLPVSAKPLADRLNALYGELTATEKQAINDAKDAAKALTASEVKGLAAPIWTRIQAKLSTATPASDYNLINQDTVSNLFLQTTIAYDPQFNNVAQAIEDNKAVIGQLLKLGNVPQGLDNPDVTYVQLATFALEVEALVKTSVTSATTLTDFMNLKITIKNKIRDLIVNDTRYATLESFLRGLNITTADAVDDMMGIQANVNAFPGELGNKLRAGANATGAAYLRLIAKESNTGTGGGILIPTTPTLPAPTFDEQLKDLEGKLDKATGAEKDKLIDQILDAADAAVAKLADFKTEVKVAGNVATADIKTSDVVKQIQDIKATFDKALKATGTTKASEVTFTLSLGQVIANKIDTPVAKEIIQAAKANGVTDIAVVVNGIAVTLPVAEFGDNVILTIAKSTQTTTSATASALYDIDLTVGGKAQSEFNNKLTLSLPVTDVSKYDKELLVVAKVVDGKLQIIGGSLKGDNVSVPRDGLSTYTVVENKVSFNDLTKVQAWAGRQIEVAAAKGILEGRQAGTFDPSANVTRAEFAKLIVKTFFLEDKKATEAFSDVSADAWYGEYVAAAAKLGIITGRNAGTFDPNAKISRAEMATMAARALKLVDAGVAKVDIAVSLKDFKDASSISNSLKEGVAIAAAQGIVIGDKGSFKPQGNSTRAEAAVVIYRLLKSQE